MENVGSIAEGPGQRSAARIIPDSRCRIAIIGAGPYGLAVAAALRAKGSKPRTFGAPMEFWLKQTPSGMFLRSRQRASNIGDPTHHLQLGDFAAMMGKTLADQTRVEDFREYGLWYQRHAVPEVDRRKVTKLAKTREAFRLTLEDGEKVEAASVVVAAGIGAFAYTPLSSPEFPPGWRRILPVIPTFPCLRAPV